MRGSGLGAGGETPVVKGGATADSEGVSSVSWRLGVGDLDGGTRQYITNLSWLEQT